MSYTFAVCNAALPEGIGEANATVERLTEEAEPNPGVFNELVERLLARYPCICDLPPDRADDGVWCSGPLRQERYTRATVFGLSRDIETVMPFIIETATGLGLTLLDWQTCEIHRPNVRGAEQGAT